MNVYSGLATFGKIRRYIISFILMMIALATGAAGMRKISDDKTRDQGETLLGISALCAGFAILGVYLVRKYKPLAAANGAMGVLNAARLI